MAPAPTTPRRQSRGRPRGRPKVTASASASRVRKATSDAPATEPPPKKKRYIPGGPGGGGRFVDEDGIETPAQPSGSAATAPRPRASTANRDNASPSVFPRRERSTRIRTAVNRDKLDDMQYSSAAAVAAAVVQSEGYKPREERGWEEFHPNLDIEATFMTFPAEEVDGIVAPAPPTPAPAPAPSSMNPLNGATTPTKDTNIPSIIHTTPSGQGKPSFVAMTDTPSRRRPARPTRDSVSLYATRPLDFGLTPKTPKVLPIHNQTPKERLDLKLPSYRKTDRIARFEKTQAKYVDKSMMNVGYQESDNFIRPDRKLLKAIDANAEEDLDEFMATKPGGELVPNTAGVVGRVEYDMDEQDDMWLEKLNVQRKDADLDPITREIFEITITKIEKEWHALEKRIPKPNPKPPQTHRPRSSSAAAVNGEPQAGEEQDSKCAICDDGDCENTNAIVFCDGCDLAVHQECYGVPFIPEGQWLCRKCQLIGRGIPTCIFCPNTDGAFKQTNSSKWAHLLCAMWIPEVSLGNHTFMEPVMEVEKVPKTRWRLSCYICNQRMGACIQCSNKNCYQAFHVTCARRCRLYLKMKNSQGALAVLDGSLALKAFCDKHCPQDYAKENSVHQATKDAKRFYKRTMKGRIWADSQASALQLAATHRHAITEHPPDESQMTGAKVSAVLGDKKKGQPGKPIWKLPSGAPIIPQAVYDLVESSLARFPIRKRKDFVAEACRYWTLKREARRGAALLKRLQLQMETFSSMELTRRNFPAMGPSGKARLARRIKFAQTLIQDLEQLMSLSNDIVQREAIKLEAADLEHDFVDTTYFPVYKLLVPVVEKAFQLDIKNIFKPYLAELQEKLDRRLYTTTLQFSHDLCRAINSGINAGANKATDEARMELEMSPSKQRDKEVKERRKIGKRVLRLLQPQLEAALKAEADICSLPLEGLKKELEDLLHNSLDPRQATINVSQEDDAAPSQSQDVEMADAGQIIVADGSVDGETADAGSHADHDRMDVDDASQSGNIEVNTSEDRDDTASAISKQVNGAISSAASVADEQAGGQANSDDKEKQLQLPNGISKDSVSPPSLPGYGGLSLHKLQPLNHSGPLTPPQSNGSLGRDPVNVLTDGGVASHLKGFKIKGTSAVEEEWAGRDAALSEELTDMDDEALKDLEHDVDGDDTITASMTDANGTALESKTDSVNGVPTTTAGPSSDSFSSFASSATKAAAEPPISPAAASPNPTTLSTPRRRSNPNTFRKGVRSSARRR